MEARHGLQRIHLFHLLNVKISSWAKLLGSSPFFCCFGIFATLTDSDTLEVFMGSYSWKQSALPTSTTHTVFIIIVFCHYSSSFTQWGCCGLCQGHKSTKLAHSFLHCSCVYFCRVFSDELRVSTFFPDRFPHYALTAQYAHSNFVGSRVYAC